MAGPSFRLLALTAAVCLVLAGCGDSGGSGGTGAVDDTTGGDPEITFEILPTQTTLNGAPIGGEELYWAGSGHGYRIRVKLTYRDGIQPDPASVNYHEAGTGDLRYAQATRVGATDEYYFDLPTSTELELCEEMRYWWWTRYETDTGDRQFASGDELTVMPTARLTSAGIDQLACADVRYEDVDGSARVETVPISMISGPAGCEYRLEFNNPDNRPDYAVHQVGGNPDDPKHQYLDPECEKAEFTTTEADSQAHFDLQTTYYWSMLAREYAREHLWVEPPGWTQGPRYSQRPVGPNVLSRDGGFNTACALTPDPKAGCFRAWTDPEGGRYFVEQGHVSPEVVLHEYGHYAAAYMFGYATIPPFGPFNPLDCTHRGFQEATAEMFLGLVLHDARYLHYAALDPVANGVPRSGFELIPLDTWDGLCGSHDYEWGRPLVQAFHELLWDGAWPNPMVANDAMAAAFSTALAFQTDMEADLFAHHILVYLQGHHPGQVQRASQIFGAHGF